MNLSDYQSNCRLCLKPNMEMMNIMIESCEKPLEEPLVQTIFSLFNIQLHRHPSFPQNMCRTCWTGIKHMLLFMRDVTLTQNFLFSLYQNEASANSTEVSNEDNNNEDISSVKEETVNVKSRSEQEFDCSQSDLDTFWAHHKPPQTSNSNRENQCGIRRSTRHGKKQTNFQNLDIKDDELDSLSFAATTSPSSTSSSEIEIPQASFLQNLDLVTLQDAKSLKNMKPISRPRQRFIPKKLLDSATAPPANNHLIGVWKTKKRESPSRTASKPKRLMAKPITKTPPRSSSNNKDSQSSDALRISNRSMSFLTRYGFRKLNNTQLKRGKIIHKASALPSLSLDKSLRETRSSPGRKKSPLSPINLCNKSTSTKAVTNPKGCENQSYLFNRIKQEISTDVSVKNEPKPQISTISKLQQNQNNTRSSYPLRTTNRTCSSLFRRKCVEVSPDATESSQINFRIREDTPQFWNPELNSTFACTSRDNTQLSGTTIKAHSDINVAKRRSCKDPPLYSGGKDTTRNYNLRKCSERRDYSEVSLGIFNCKKIKQELLEETTEAVPHEIKSERPSVDAKELNQTFIGNHKLNSGNICRLSIADNKEFQLSFPSTSSFNSHWENTELRTCSSTPMCNSADGRAKSKRKSAKPVKNSSGLKEKKDFLFKALNM